MIASIHADNQTNTSATLDVLLFRLGDEFYAFPSASVREVTRYRAYTPIPGAPPTLPGILSQRGIVLPVVEMHTLLGIEAATITRSTRIVIVSHGEVDMALVVDAVLDLVVLTTETIEPLPIALDPSRSRFLRGIAQYEEQPVALIDLDELIAGLRAAG